MRDFALNNAPPGRGEAETTCPLTITRLHPSNLTTDDTGNVRIHSPSQTLTVLLGEQATVVPGDLELFKHAVLLVPTAYPCTLVGCSESCPIELASIDLNFEIGGFDSSFLLPKEPMIFYDKSAERLVEGICTVCQQPATELTIGQNAERLAAGYRIASVLADELKLDASSLLASQGDPGLQTLVSFLHRNYHLPLTIEDIIAECGVSRRQVFKIAARLEEITPMRLLKKIRLENSLELLRKRELNIGKVAEIVGFADAKNFSREFKSAYGMTPIQYRQQTIMSSGVANIVRKAEINMQLNVPKRASVLYGKAIESAGPWTNVDELYYKCGMAQRQAGDLQGAAESWNKVTALKYRLLVDLERCVDASKSASPNQILEWLRHCYTYGNESIRKQVVDRLGDWMIQCATDEKFVAAYKYCELGKELVGDHPAIAGKLAKALFATGQFMEVLRYCPNQEFFVAAALRATGHYREHLERFSKLREQCAHVLIRMGDYERVCKDYGDLSELCVNALIQAGRPEDAVEAYPTANFPALLALGRYQDVLDRHPDDPEGCMWAHEFLGHDEQAMEISKSKSSWRANLLLHRETPEEIISSQEYPNVYHIAATVMHAIHLLEQRQFGQALAILESVLPMTDPNYHFAHAFYFPDLFIPLIRFLHPEASSAVATGKWAPWHSHFHSIVQNHQYCYVQNHWYAVRLIMDEIDDDAFLQQPCRAQADVEINLVRGLKAEFQGRGDDAEAFYAEYLRDMSEPKKLAFFYQWFWPVKKAFVRWRLHELRNRQEMNA